MEESPTVNEAIAILRNEATRRSRYQTRFVLVEGLDAWRAMIDTIQVYCDSVVCCSDLCSGQDSLPAMDRLFDSIRKGLLSSSNLVLMLPFAEVLRYSPESRWVLRELSELSVPGSFGKRVVVPLLGLEGVFREEMQGVERYRAGVLPPVIRIRGVDKVRVVLTPPPVKCRENEAKIVHGFREYLRLWESGGHSTVNLISRLVNVASDQVGVVNLVVRKSAYEVLVHSLDEVAQCKEEWGDQEQWQWLLEECQEASSLTEVCVNLLGITKPTLAFWQHLNRNERWLLWLWFKAANAGGSYMRSVLNRSSSVREFEEEVVTAAFSVDLDLDLARERHQMISDLHLTSLSRSFWEQYSRVTDPVRKLMVLPGVGQRDLYEIILAVKELLANGVERESWEGYVYLSYKPLFDYLQPLRLPDSGLANYVNAYKTARLQDCLTAQLEQAVAEVSADDRAFWMFSPRSHVIEQVGDATRIWVDGMGMEWVTVMVGYLKSRAPGVEVDILPARANLPTITETNKEQMADTDDLIHDLDKIGHSYDYSFPESFIQQMYIISEVVNKAIDYLQTSQRVVITSDHGLSRFALRGPKYENIAGVVARRNGRYGEVVHESNCRVCGIPVIQEGSLVAIRGYGRFSCEGGSVGEVHGGASIEEAIVPVLVLTRPSPTGPAYQELGERVVRLDRDGRAVLHVSLSVPVRTAEARIRGQRSRGTMVGPMTWEFRLHGIEPNQYDVLVLGDGTPIGTISLRLLPGGIREKRFGL